MTAIALALRQIKMSIWSIDRVVMAVAVIFLALLVGAPDQAAVSLVFTLDALLWISPFLALSVVLAAGAKATGLDQQVAAVFKGKTVRVIIIASAFGAVSPFCSCGVVPLIAGLLGAGVPLAPVMAFWISSPIMDPEMFVLTTAVLGLPFAVGKTVAAFAMGAFSGFAIHAMAKHPVFTNPLKDAYSSCGASSCGPSSCGDTPDDAPVVWTFWRHADRLDSFTSESKATALFLFKWLAFAFVLESLMVAYIPADAVARVLGGSEWWVIPASVLIGIPTYLNGYAAIPTVSALLDMGMVPGAALAFMVGGGVTSIPAAMAVFAIVKRPVFFWYIALAISGSMVAGFAFGAVYDIF